MKLGFFATGSTDRLDFAEFARWGAEHGYQAMDVPPDRPGTRAMCERFGLQVSCTSGSYGAQTERGEWWRYRLPGFGVVDWPKYLDTLYQVGFDGVISVEHEDNVWGAGDDSDRAKRGLILAQRFLAPLLV